MRSDGIVVGRQAEQIDRDDRPRLQAGALGGRHRALADLPASILKVAASTSTKTGVAPTSATTSAVAQNVKDGQITASPGPISLGHQHQQQRVGAAGAGDGMAGAAEGGKLGFEARAPRARG